MRKSLLLTILLATLIGCGDDAVAPEPSVRANLIIDFEGWDQEGQERRQVQITVVRNPISDIRYFEDLPQEGVVTITTTLPCSGDHLWEPIIVDARGVGVSGSKWLEGFACTEEAQIVEVPLVTIPIGGCINPDNWLGDC